MKKLLFMAVAAVSLMAAECVSDIPNKLVVLYAQQGNLVVGRAGTATFYVATLGIADGSRGTISWFSNSSGTTSATAPVGVTASVSNVTNSTASVTVNTSAATPQGTYFFRVTIDGQQSGIAMLAVLPL